MGALNERVIREMERLLERELKQEEIRLLLLANVIEEEIMEREPVSTMAA